jgi:hypothetical protein
MTGDRRGKLRPLTRGGSLKRARLRQHLEGALALAVRVQEVSSDKGG